jgi:hypothetical protein
LVLQEKTIEISVEKMSIIMQARRTLLFLDKDQWTKKTGDEEFDVPMGCFDGAEVCELVGLYILEKIGKIMGKENVGLYRDDGLGIFKNIPKSEIERKKKKIIKIFKECNLKITVETNLHTVDFLDVQLNLKNNSYGPYRKPDNNPVYINVHSNHPKNI